VTSMSSNGFMTKNMVDVVGKFVLFIHPINK